MEALVVKSFFDKENNKYVNKGSVINVTTERFNEITNKIGALNIIESSSKKKLKK